MSDRSCEAPGCQLPHRAKGLCVSHYMSQYRKENPRSPLPKLRQTFPPADSLSEYFWMRVKKGDECWEWIGSKTAEGYGRAVFKYARLVAHRVSLDLHGITVDERKVVDHLCSNRSCVNPSHLRIVGSAENAQNLGSLRADNTSGVRGVYWDGDSSIWRGQVRAFGRKYTFRSVNKPEVEDWATRTRERLHTPAA